MKKKLRIFLILFVVLSVTVFAGGQKEPVPAEGKAITISYALWDRGQAPGMQSIIDRFEELNPGIKVSLEVSNWGEYWTKLEAAATGAAMPDVFWMHASRIRKYATNDKLMPIGDRVKSDPELDYSNYPEGVVKIYEIEGVNYSIPKDFDTIGLCYNKEMFAAEGIPYPDETWDWDRFLQASGQLTDESKGVYGFAANAADQLGYYNFIYQNGGYVINADKTKSGFDLPETIEAIRFYYDMIHKHHVSPTVELMADTNPGVMFASGKVAMYFVGSWLLRGLDKNEATKKMADMAVLPKMVKRASIYNGLGNSVAADTKYPEEAWEFLKFLGTKEANLIQAESGAAIPAFKGTQQPWIDGWKDFNVKVFVDMVDYGVAYPTSKTAPKWGSFQKEMMIQILSGRVEVEDGCKKIAIEMNKLLATE